MYSFFPAIQLFRLINKYRPGTKLDKMAHLRAEERVRGKEDTPTKKPPVVRSGIESQHCDLTNREQESSAGYHCT